MDVDSAYVPVDEDNGEDRYYWQAKACPCREACSNSSWGRVTKYSYLSEETVRKYIKEHMARVFTQTQFITDDRVEEIFAILSNRMNVLNLIHAARSAKKDNLLEHLKEIKVPTLLLWGEDDQVTTMDVAEAFEKHIPNSKLVTVKNCGHAPMIEHPEWFAEEVRKFLVDNGQIQSP